ncbi:MAG: HlyD family efflux transporter periplasmic adaptor subunit, partial [Deltaproteobacteria bacterium]|nr:HlyD family efflux transporter periplasmic adaptor subunit [Deltaproteobacteria bacterium]
EYSRYKTQAESLQNTINAGELRIQQLESERNVFINNWRKDLSTEIARYSNELDTYKQRLAKAERYSELVDIAAPQDSVVLEVGKISIGSVAKTGEALARLVPLNEPLEVEARISPQDIGFIRHGDLCKVKIDAFPFQKHGDLKGHLKSIGEDTQQDPSRPQEGPYYTARIELESLTLKKVPKDNRLIPGMSLSAEIVVGKRTVISYILYPMIKLFDESIREP